MLQKSLLFLQFQFLFSIFRLQQSVTNNNIEDHGLRPPPLIEFLPAILNVYPGRNGEFLS